MLSRRTVFVSAAAAIFWSPVLAADGELSIEGWQTGGSGSQDYDFGTTELDGTPGKCAYIRATTVAPKGYGNLSQKVSAGDYRGRRLRLSAQIKTEDAANAVLWMRVEGPDGKVLDWYGMADRPISGTTDWKRYDVVLDVQPEAVAVAFGYRLMGGTAWARDFKLDPVGKDVPLSAGPILPLPKAPVNLDFGQ